MTVHMKRILKFIVDGQTIKKDPTCDFSGIYRGTAGYLQAQFSFSEEWRGCKKAASFYRHLGKEHAVLLVNNQCEIPAEALTGSEWSVSVTGIKDNFKITTGREKVTQG